MCLHYLVKLSTSFVVVHCKHAWFCDKKVMFHNLLNVNIFANMYRKCWFADDILFGVTVCSKYYTKYVITLHNGCMWLKESKKTVTVNFISSQIIKRQQYIMYSSKHNGSSRWLLKIIVSTVSENLVPKVHNL